MQKFRKATKKIFVKIEKRSLTLLNTTKQKSTVSKDAVNGNNRKIIKNILKSYFACFLYYSGLLIFSFANYFKKRIIILSYHRINESVNDPLGMSVSPSLFEKQLRCLKRFFWPISLNKAIELIKSNKRLNKNYFVITFDDGYFDNYSSAYPILKQYGIPATIFITVDPINKRKDLWFDYIIKAFNMSKSQQIDFDEFSFGRIFLKNVKQKFLVVSEIVKYLKSLKPTDREAKINYMLNKLHLSQVDTSGCQELLDWETIRKLQKEGIDIGSHGLSHTIMTNFTLSEARAEIADSMKIILEQTGVRPLHFAYPNGGMSDFNSDIEKLAAEVGYSSASTLIDGFNEKGADIFALKRFCVGPESGLDYRKSFSQAIFLMEVNGVFAGLGKIIRKKKYALMNSISGLKKQR